MAKAVIIYGKSGSGKSRSMKMFNEDEIMLINVEEKDLPFRKKFKYVLCSDNYETIKNALMKAPTKTIVIDDAGYLLTNMFMKKHASGLKGNAVFDLYNDIGDSFWGLLTFIKKQLPNDVVVFIVMHEDTSDFGETKLKTIGKLLDEKVNIQGMVTIALRCMSDNGRHFFRTVTDGSDITKAPEDMFEQEEIENDLKMVNETIRNYYEI